MKTIALLAAAVMMLACSAAPQNSGDAGTLPTEDAAPPATDAASPKPDAGTAVDAAPPPASQTFFGAAFSPHGDARFTTLSSEWSGMQVVRTYDNGQGVKPFASAQTQDISWKTASAYSFKYDPSTVIAGTHDADLQSFFESIEDGHPVFWTYFHEPDDQIFVAHAFTASDYRSAWAHIRGIFDAVKAKRPNMIAYATFICMEYSMTAKVAPSRPLDGPNGMYPGDAVIDVFGVDAYNESGTTDVTVQFGTVIDYASAHKKPWAIGGFGSCATGRAAYLKSAIEYWKSRDYVPMYVAYFDVDWTSSGACDYRFDSDSASTALWQQAMTKGIASF